MVELLRREFEVDVSIEQAWKHLARVEQWPTWARYIRRIDLIPPGELGPASVGVIRLTNGIKSAFAMTEFSPQRSWKWSGKLLWLTVHYDHRFVAASAARTRLTWIVEAEGFGVSVLGRMFAKAYARNLDRAIPLLVAEMNASPPT